MNKICMSSKKKKNRKINNRIMEMKIKKNKKKK